MTDALGVVLDAWIIQDGNYGDFTVGEQRAFALEFGGTFEATDLAPCELVHVEDADYIATARVVHTASDWWAIDAGVLLFCEERPPACAVRGRFVQGVLTIAVDPFFYFEVHGAERNAPALIYDWLIESIEIETAPFIDVGHKMRARDPKKLAWKHVPETRAWTDDDGHGSYLLRVRRLENPPRRTLRADATP